MNSLCYNNSFSFTIDKLISKYEDLSRDCNVKRREQLAVIEIVAKLLLTTQRCHLYNKTTTGKPQKVLKKNSSLSDVLTENYSQINYKAIV